MTERSNPVFWLIIAFVLGLAVIGGMTGNSSNSGGSGSTPSAEAPNSVEYRYARERFRQEGYNSADADTAARAVLKFHEAQQRAR